ncbi:MAG: hypothetical protein K2J13_03470 [Clostridia bacterium]|nr:hypothetical protein [Clostridia bacterium]
MEKDIKCVSISYDEWKIFGTVWYYEDFRILLENLLNDNKLILGGDILTKDENGVLGCSSCSWYYEGDSVLHSNIEAQKYLSSLEEWATREKLFISIVLKS